MVSLNEVNIALSTNSLFYNYITIGAAAVSLGVQQQFVYIWTLTIYYTSRGTLFWSLISK